MQRKNSIDFLLWFLIVLWAFGGVFTSAPKAWAQFNPLGGIQLDDDDIGVGTGDIFSDFEEEVESGQILEDERFYRHARFYAVQFNLGHTTYTGNRGSAYTDRFPSMGLSLTYFLSFKVAYGIGVEYSQHYFAINERVNGFDLDGGPGLIEVNMFRSHFYMRYYIDTYDLGTAFTYSNPYFVGRLEVWDQTNKFIDLANQLPNVSNSAIGTSAGIGFEFPITLKESYLNVELLYHKVNFSDSNTQAYVPEDGSSGGFQNLQGDVLSLFSGFVMSW